MIWYNFRMSRYKIFSNVLSRLRKEQGFPGAYKFFISVGGSKSLGVSFTSYWDIERGKKLPKSWRLKTIMNALGIEQDSPKAKELVRAYFTALAGSDDLLQIIGSPVTDSPDLTSRELADALAQQALARRTAHLTPEQWNLRARNLETYICMNFLVCTAGWVTVRELLDATGFKEAVVRKALKAMAAGKLIELRGDKARTGLAQKFIQPPPRTPAMAAVRGRQRAYWQTWLSDDMLVERKALVVRFTKASLALYLQHLEKAVRLAAVYHDSQENREDSAVYYLNSTISQAYPRK